MIYYCIYLIQTITIARFYIVWQIHQSALVWEKTQIEEDFMKKRMDCVRNADFDIMGEKIDADWLLKIINILYQKLQIELGRKLMSSNSICSVDDTIEEQNNFLSEKMKKMSQIMLRKTFISELSSIKAKSNKMTEKQQFKGIQEETLKIHNQNSPKKRNLYQSRNLKKSQNYSLYSSYKLQKNSYKPKESSFKDNKKLRFRQIKENIADSPAAYLKSHQKIIQIESIQQLNGKGILQTPDGRTLIGQWINGNMIGLARILYPSKEVYQGPVNYKHQKQGYGVLTFPNGDHYEGSFHLGKFHGIGKLVSSKGTVLVQGSWDNGRFIKDGNDGAI